MGERTPDWEQLARTLHASYLLRWDRHDHGSLKRVTGSQPALGRRPQPTAERRRDGPTAA